jgi:hypothetical protein
MVADPSDIDRGLSNIGFTSHMGNTSETWAHAVSAKSDLL